MMRSGKTFPFHLHLISIIFSTFLQHILNTTDPFIQIAFINTLKVIEQTYPTSLTLHVNQLLELGKRTGGRFWDTLCSD